MPHHHHQNAAAAPGFKLKNDWTQEINEIYYYYLPALLLQLSITILNEVDTKYLNVSLAWVTDSQTLSVWLNNKKKVVCQ